MPENKTDIVRRLVAGGDYKKALGIVKNFKLRIANDDSKKMSMAYEYMVHPAFYNQFGNDLKTAVSEGISILKSIYGKE